MPMKKVKSKKAMDKIRKSMPKSHLKMTEAQHKDMMNGYRKHY